MTGKFKWIIKLQLWLARHGVKYYSPMLKLHNKEEVRR